MNKIIATGILITLLLNISIVSAENFEKLDNIEKTENYNFINAEIQQYYIPNIEIELSQSICEKEIINQNDDDVELLWNHSGDGEYVISAFINNDDIPDILASSYAINGLDGSTFFQFENGKVIGVGDINCDGKDEIFSFVDNRDTGLLNSTLFCLNSSNGNIIWERIIDSTWIFSVSIANVTGDENSEVIVGVGDYADRNNNYIYCLNSNNGTTIWRKYVNDYVQSTAIDDVNADGKNEILAGTRVNDPRLYCLDGDTGESIWEIVKQTGVIGFRTICIGELNQDVYKEIVVDLVENDKYGIFCVSGNNGSTLWTWNQEPDGEGWITVGSFQSILIADMIPSIPGNEVIVGGVCGVYCLYGNDDPPFGEREIWHAGRANEIVMTFVMSMAVGDLNQDGLSDVVAITTSWLSGEGNVYAIQGQYGSLLWMYENCTSNGFHAILCENVTGDEAPEVFAKDDSEVLALLNSFPSNNINPNIPIIDGPNFGYIFLSYNYTAISTDPNYDDVYYYVDWGDGKRTTSKIGASGETVIIPKIWKTEGNYSIKAKTIDEHGAYSNWSEPFDVVMIYVPSVVNITKPGNALYINNREINQSSSPIIVGNIDINVNATDEIYGINRVEFYIDDEFRATDFTKPYSWTWDENISGNHTIKVAAINTPGIYETSEITVMKSSGGSDMDQVQTQHNSASMVYGGYDDGYKNYTVAQTFIPTKKIITKIYLYIKDIGTFNNYVLSISENLNDNAIAKVTVDKTEIGYNFGWLEFNFGELEVNPGQTYYIVSYVARDKPFPGGYAWAQFDSDVYPYGIKYAYFPKLHRWIGYQNIDMCFRILGRNNLIPETPTIDGPKFGESGIQYNFTFNASDPEGSDLYYFVDWGDNTYDQWVGPCDSGENLCLTHTWNNSGFYKIYAIVKDEQNLLSYWSDSFIIDIDMPYEPSNPNPADGRNYYVYVGDPIWPDVLLSWNGGDPNSQDLVNYDIYFGRDSDNLVFIDTIGPFPATQTQIEPYDLGILNSPGRYYWKIVAIDNHSNEVEGPIWHFYILEYYIPSQPSNPVPNQQSNQQSNPNSQQSSQALQLKTILKTTAK